MRCTNIDFIHEDEERTNPIFFMSHYENGKKVITKSRESFAPYFYINEDAFVPPSTRKLIKNIESGYKTFRGKPVKKITCSSLSKNSFLMLRDAFDVTYEDDILFLHRYIIDKKIKYSDEQRICYFDIETDMGLDIVKCEQPIISISCFDSFFNKYIYFIWHKDEEERKESKGDESTYYFNSEKALLLKFVQFLHDTKPDVITGWYIEGFDIPYLMGRMIRNNLDKNSLSWLGKVDYKIEEDSKKTYVKIFGTSIVDLLTIYRKLTYDNRPDNYRLDTVGKHELNLGKLKHENIRKMWNENRKMLLDYNKRDVEITVKLDRAKYLIKYFLILQQLVPMPLEKMYWNSYVVDMYILQKYNGKFVFPSKRKNESVERGKGALTGKLVFDDIGNYEVKNPDPGIYKNVAVLDFSKMYSSIYQTFNISPDTKMSDGDIDIGGIRYTSFKQGLIPAIFNELFAERKKITTQRDKCEPGSQEEISLLNLQGGVKQIMNSIYGVMGFRSFRLYDLDILESVTYMGRKMLALVWKVSEEMGYDVLYGDTDSIFVRFDPNLEFNDMLHCIDKLTKRLNEKLKMMTKEMNDNLVCSLEIECEKVFEKIMLFDVKKRYFGRLSWKKGRRTNEFFYRGVEIVRRDTPDFFKGLLKGLLIDILDGTPIDEMQEKIQKYKDDFRKLTYWQVGMTKTVAKNLKDYTVVPQHLRAVLYSNKHFKTRIKRLDLPKIVYVTHANTEVIALENEDTKIPIGYPIDVQKYFDIFVHKKLELFSAVNNDLLQLSTGNYNLKRWMKDV